MTSSTIRLGTCSPATQSTTPETLALVSRLAERAAEKKIDILLLPEALLGGYPRGTHFGATIGGRTAAGRAEYAAYFHSAVDFGDTVGDGGAGAGEKWVRRELPVPGGGSEANGQREAKEQTRRGDGTREELEAIAKRTGVFVVVGAVEKAGGSLYCSAVYVCPKLGCVGKRRKVCPTGTERLVWAPASPASLRAITTTIRGTRINLAAAICWENYMPLLRQSLYAQNINLYLAPTADGRDTWLSLMRTVGIEGRCFVVSSNMCTSKKAAETVSAGDKNGTHAVDETGSARTSLEEEMLRRRNSAITEEGFEEATMHPPQQGGTHPALRSETSAPRSRSRRKSVFDEDGNEIVLCCDDDGKKVGRNASGLKEKPAVTKAVGETATASDVTKTRGGSCIVGPFGDVLAGPQWDDPDGMIFADVDFEECIQGRLDIDVAGHYSRNDSFKFSVTGLDMDPLPY